MRESAKTSESQDGGPAFPIIKRYVITDKSSELEMTTGLSMLDYFAAKAMQAMCSNIDSGDDHLAIAHESYEIADAMIVARADREAK